MAVTLTILNNGVQRTLLLKLNKGGVTLGDLVMALYKNNHAPVVTDNVAQFTEPTAAGYARKTLTGATWAVTTAAGVSVGTYPTQTFTFTNNGGGETIFGVFLINDDSNADMAGLLDTPFVIPAGGGSVLIDLEIDNQQC